MAIVSGGQPVSAADENNQYINGNGASRTFGIATTTDATPTEVVFVAGVQPGVYQYKVQATGHNETAAGEDVGYFFVGAVSCAADGTMADVGTAVKHAFEHASSTGCDIAIDVATDNRIAFKCTGEAATTYNWSACVELFGPADS